MHRGSPVACWGGSPGGWRISRGLRSREGGTGHAPGDRTRNHCAPFLAIFHLYTPENPSTPRLSLYSYSLHPLCSRQDGRAMHRIGAEGANPALPPRAPRILRYLFIIIPKVRPPLIPVPPDARESGEPRARARRRRVEADAARALRRRYNVWVFRGERMISCRFATRRRCVSLVPRIPLRFAILPHPCVC